MYFFFFSSRRRHTRFDCDWSSDVCSSDLEQKPLMPLNVPRQPLMCLLEPAQTAERRAPHLARLEQVHDDRDREQQDAQQRSEERRVGKECRSRWWADQ